MYEGQGNGTWSGGPHDIPTTAKEDHLGIPEWTGEGELLKRVSRDHLSVSTGKRDSPTSYGRVESPLIDMKDRHDNYGRSP